MDQADARAQQELTADLRRCGSTPWLGQGKICHRANSWHCWMTPVVGLPDQHGQQLRALHLTLSQTCQISQANYALEIFVLLHLLKRETWVTLTEPCMALTSQARSHSLQAGLFPTSDQLQGWILSRFLLLTPSSSMALCREEPSWQVRGVPRQGLAVGSACCAVGAVWALPPTSQNTAEAFPTASENGRDWLACRYWPGQQG